MRMLSPVYSVHYLWGGCIGSFCLQWLGFKFIMIFNNFHQGVRSRIFLIRSFSFDNPQQKGNDKSRMHFKCSAYFNAFLVEVGRKKMKHGPVAQAPPNISRFAMRVWATWQITLWESERFSRYVGCSCVALCGCFHSIVQTGTIL